VKELLFLAIFLLHQGASSVIGMRGTGFAWDALWKDLLSPAGTSFAVAAYYLSLAGLYGIYLSFLKDSALPRARRRLWLLGAITCLALTLTPASRSTDIYAYLAHGHNGAANLRETYARGIYPEGTPPSPYLEEISARSGLVNHGPSPYGPLWAHLEILNYRATGASVFAGALALKGLGTLSLLGIALLAVPLSGPLAALSLLLNPLLLTEFAAEGHNDALMILFLVLGLYGLKRTRLTGAVLALAAGVLTKYIPALLALPAARYLLSRKSLASRAVGLGVAASAALAALLYFPLWIGGATFQGVRDNSEAIPAFLRPLQAALSAAPLVATGLRTLLALLLLGLTAWVTLRAKSLASLILGGAVLLLGYFLFFPAFVWPWYLAGPVVLLLLLPPASYQKYALLFAVNASLVGPVWALYKAGSFTASFGRGLHHALLPGCAILIFAALLQKAFSPPELP